MKVVSSSPLIYVASARKLGSPTQEYWGISRRARVTISGAQQSSNGLLACALPARGSYAEPAKPSW